MTAEEYTKAKADVAEYENALREKTAKKTERLAEFCNELFPGSTFFAKSINIEGSRDSDSLRLSIEFVHGGEPLVF